MGIKAEVEEAEVKEAGPLILLVDRNLRNLQLLERFLGNAGFLTRPAPDLTALDAAIAEAADGGINLALVDLSGFDSLIWERCRLLRDIGVPFLLLSPRQTDTLQRQSIDHGAMRVMIKPLVSGDLINILKLLLKTDLN